MAGNTAYANIRLPTPPAEYSQRDQAEFRRAIEEWVRTGGSVQPGTDVARLQITSPDQFSGSVKPVEIYIDAADAGTARPTDTIAFFTDDSQLYRWNGSAWVPVIDAVTPSIPDGSITTAKLADAAVLGAKLASGGVTSDKLAANVVTADKLAVGFGGGAALNADPNTADATAWTTLAHSTLWTVGSQADSPTGRALWGPMNDRTWVCEQRRVPFDPNKVYRARMQLRSSATANGFIYPFLRFFDGAGFEIATGGPGLYWYFGAPAATTPGTSWVEASLVFTAGTAMIFGASAVPSSARFMSIGCLLNEGGTTGQQALADPRIEEVLPGTLIMDGAVTTPKIFAGAITADKIAASAVTASKIEAGAVIADKIASNAITSDKLAANSVVAGKISAGAIGATEIAAGSISAAHLQAGSITADKIVAGEITATKLNISNLSLISTNLGTITAGRMQNASNTRWLDLNASGSSAVLKHDALELLGDGSAVFSGIVAATTFTSTNATFQTNVNIGRIVEGALRLRCYAVLPSTGYVGDIVLAPDKSDLSAAAGFSSQPTGLNISGISSAVFIGGDMVASVRRASGAPSGSAREGTFYVRTDVTELYLRAGGTWNLIL